eukprot:3709219-Rhodomonas_salina.3
MAASINGYRPALLTLPVYSPITSYLLHLLVIQNQRIQDFACWEETESNKNVFDGHVLWRN